VELPWSAAQASVAGKSNHDERTTEAVEAEVRRLMAQHAAIVPRGWQGMKDREILHRKIDRLLDEHAMRAEVEAVTK
jgi:hypothetical protein